MKKWSLYLLLCVIVVNYSCKKDRTPFVYPTCPSGYSDITNIFSIDSLLRYCLDINQLEDEYIIDEDSVYQKLLNLKTGTAGCNTFSLPTIDFSQNTIIAKFAGGGGCSTQYFRKVCEDKSNKIIQYIIKVHDKGNCAMLNLSMNWMVVPKIASDYTIVFDIQQD